MREKIIIFLKGSAALLIANLCTKAINFFLLPLYTKYLSPEQLGVSDSITTMTSLFFPILVLGLDSAYSAFYFDEKTDTYKNKVFSTTSFTLILTSVVPCIGIFFSRQIASILFGTEEYGWIVIIALFGMVCNLWYLPFSLYLRVENKMTAFAVISVVSSLVMIVSNIITVTVINLGAAALIVSTLVTNIIMLILYAGCSKKLPSPNAVDLALNKRMLKYSIPLVPMVVSTWILTTASRIILLHFCGEESVGIYGIGTRFVNIVNVFSNSIYTAYTTFAFSSKDEENNREVYAIILDVMNFVLTAVVFFVCIFSIEILDIFVDPQYYQAFILLPGLLFAQLFYAANTIVGYGLAFEKRSDLSLLCVTTAAIVSVVLNFIFIPKYGGLAASLTTWVGYGVMLIMTNHFSQKIYECPYKVKKIFVINSIMLAIILVSLNYLSLLYRIIICAAVLAGLVFCYRNTVKTLYNALTKSLKGRKNA